MRKFNIGDKIKVIGNCNSHGYKIGGEYTIKCHDSLCEEPNENGYAYNLDANVCGAIIREKDMELVKPKEPVIFINDDGVSIRCSKPMTMDDMTCQGVLSQDEMNKLINKYSYEWKLTEKYNRYVKGEWKNMENEVLELWYARKHNKIMKEYEEKEREFHNSKELVIKYKEIVERFENELEELYESEENIEKGYIKDELTGYMYKYKINYDKLSDEFVDEYISERANKLHELDELRKEINAQLSLSNDLEYQLDVLSRYGVLNKKTKKMVD